MVIDECDVLHVDTMSGQAPGPATGLHLARLHCLGGFGVPPLGYRSWLLSCTRLKIPRSTWVTGREGSSAAALFLTPNYIFLAVGCMYIRTEDVAL